MASTLLSLCVPLKLWLSAGSKYNRRPVDYLGNYRGTEKIKLGKLYPAVKGKIVCDSFWVFFPSPSSIQLPEISNYQPAFLIP